MFELFHRFKRLIIYLYVVILSCILISRNEILEYLLKKNHSSNKIKSIFFIIMYIHIAATGNILVFSVYVNSQR